MPEIPQTAQAAPLPPGAKPDPAADPRDAEVETAAADLVAFLNAWVARHGLTALEFCYITGTASLRQIQAMCKEERRLRAAQSDR